jgi:hypothetical protein
MFKPFLAFFILLPFCLSSRFSLAVNSGETRCFSEYLTRNTHVKGFVQVHTSLIPHFSLKIKDEINNVYFEHEYDEKHMEEKLSNLEESYKKIFGKKLEENDLQSMIWNEHNGKMNRINFAFVALSDSLHYFCINNQKKNLETYFDFNLLTGIEANDYNQLIRVKHVQPFEAKLIALNDFIKKMKRDEEKLWVKEASKSGLEQSFNFNLIWTSLLTMLMIVVISTIQYYNLKKVFKEKKLI